MNLPYDADQWTEVESSLVKGVGTKDSYLIVEFKEGSFYRYPGLAFEFDPLVHAESVGKYFHANVRKQHSQRLGAEWPEE